MTPTPYDIVREACVKANPEIIEFDKGFIHLFPERTIHLADVLLAIKGKYMIGTLHKDGGFKNGREWFGEIAWDWDLSHDSLEWHRDNQPETVEWLAGLLTNN